MVKIWINDFQDKNRITRLMRKELLNMCKVATKKFSPIKLDIITCCSAPWD